jgi:hypothetical protein
VGLPSEVESKDAIEPPYKQAFAFAACGQSPSFIVAPRISVEVEQGSCCNIELTPLLLNELCSIELAPWLLVLSCMEFSIASNCKFVDWPPQS